MILSSHRVLLLQITAVKVAFNLSLTGEAAEAEASPTDALGSVVNKIRNINPSQSRSSIKIRRPDVQRYSLRPTRCTVRTASRKFSLWLGVI